MTEIAVTDWSSLLVTVALVTAICVAGVLLGLVLTVVLVVNIPADYFRREPSASFWADKHPVVRLAGRVLKNLLGIVLIVVGGVLALPGVPGPGLLVILFGLILLDFPGKRRWERWLVSLPTVLSVINRTRAKFGKPPVVLD